MTLAISLFAVIALLWSPAIAVDAPGPNNDYGRANIGGGQGSIEWESLLHGEGL